MRITVTPMQTGEIHIAVDWLNGRKGMFTPEQAIKLAQAILHQCGNLSADEIAAIHPRM